MKWSTKTFAVVLAVGMLAAAYAFIEGFRPVSAADKAKIEALLKSFDPNSFELRLPYADAQGKTRMHMLGKAKGLANLVQSNTQRNPAAGRMTIIGSETKAHVLTNNGVIFGKQGFLRPGLQQKVRELNTILNKYHVAQ